MNSDATDFVLPDPVRQAECINLALERAELKADDVDIVSTHATGTASGDIQECLALRRVWRENGRTAFNNTKSFIGHAMGAAGPWNSPEICPPSPTAFAIPPSTSIALTPNARCLTSSPRSLANCTP